MARKRVTEKGRSDFSTTLDIKLIKQVKIKAAEQDKKVNDIIEEALREHLEGDGKDEG